MANEHRFDHPQDSPEREPYSVNYDKLSKRVAVYVHGIRFDLDGTYVSHASAMSAAQEFLRRRGVGL